MTAFPGPCFAFWSLNVIVANITIHVPEKKAVNIRGMKIGSPMLAIRRTPADHDTQDGCLGPTFCNVEIGHFYQGWYIMAIPDPGVVFDLRTWHRCNWEQLYWLFINSGSQKRRGEYLILSFNLVKVRCPTFIFFFTSQAPRVDCLKDVFMPA